LVVVSIGNKRRIESAVLIEIFLVKIQIYILSEKVKALKLTPLYLNRFSI